jgi:predicted ferric reductase
MICGPSAMMKAIKKQLKQKGVKGKNINTEEFNLS